MIFRRLLLSVALGLTPFSATVADEWFERFKAEASDEELLRFLHLMPKGGDLHNHITGSVHAEWYWAYALEAEAHGYRYYTKVRINNCRVGGNQFGARPYLLLFQNLNELEFDRLSPCEQQEYKPLTALNDEEREAWLNSIRLDKPHEGRSEFFETHWQRLGSLMKNPYLVAEGLADNAIHFGAEGVRYLEAQVPVLGFENAIGETVGPDAVLAIYRQRLAQDDVRASGVTVRFQVSLLRFLPSAEATLEYLYALASRHSDVVAVNMVGREDNDKGYPLRFLSTLRKLRRNHTGVRLSIHAGEVDEPNYHIRDTLLLGADRIGHGINLITDPDTMRLMRHGPYLIEINLISNLLLEYVDSYDQHPFPEYLRIGIPVALSTDDRGMWDSTMTDEFFVAVKEFDLTWSELKQLHRNSLSHSFLEEPERSQLIDAWAKDTQVFEVAFKLDPAALLARAAPQYRGFLCRQYRLCAR